MDGTAVSFICDLIIIIIIFPQNLTVWVSLSSTNCIHNTNSQVKS